MPLSEERLRDIVIELASRPGHEKTRTLIYDLLVTGLGMDSRDVLFEHRVPEVRGRIDALLGRTVFEFKSDLRRELADAEEQIRRYLTDKESERGERFVGIVTDGATLIPYELRDENLSPLPALATPVGSPRELLEWLSAAVAVEDDLAPTGEAVRRELGKDSLAWNIARGDLAAVWHLTKQMPDVTLKRSLWAQLLERVYGSSVDDDELFYQHTYLTIIAKTMATYALGVPIPDPSELLSGRRFQEAGIGGMVESDFFDWPLEDDRGRKFVQEIAQLVGRFDLRQVQTDVLKGLYESLIDPEQRHDLGEYYTPDWLAQRICEHIIESPLEQRVLDPACGSGAFIFHATRRLLLAAEEQGISQRDAVNMACTQVIGMDIHPVSTQISRVTFMLALGVERLRHRPARITIPIYMGDALQWNTQGFLAERDVIISVPGGDETLEFPFEVAGNPSMFDMVIERMLTLSHDNAPSDALSQWLEREQHMDTESAINTLVRTYETLRQLQVDGRDHIWGFVARNLVRPVWMSQDGQRADVVIGNPPWLSYRFMDSRTQQRFREECQRRGIWAGQVAQQQDLSAYFFARCVELYLNQTSGTIAFVMPYAAMSRRQFAGFRTGIYGQDRGRNGSPVFASVLFTEAWALTDEIQPLFPVPSCVLFAQRESVVDPGAQELRLPQTVQYASGNLPRRDASPYEAEQNLNWQESPWPSQLEGRVTGGYADMFRSGAVIIPSVLFRVQTVEIGWIGTNQAAPLVESYRTPQENPPWRDVPSLRGNVEAEFLLPMYLGSTILPYRTEEPILAVIPWDRENSRIFDSEQAQLNGYAYLYRWLRDAERLYAENGTGRRTLVEQLDYYGQLSAQFPTSPLRVVYGASGTQPAAAILRGRSAIVEHNLYWGSVESQDEGRYLTAILNSETARNLVEHLQARGQWGARHFDKYILSLPIPQFDAENSLHMELSAASASAEQVAQELGDMSELYFVTARRQVRAALEEDGIGPHIERLVERLLEV